jgi:hypothetical protein
LGAGISSYHQQLVHFFLLFAVLVCLHVPVMAIYNSYDYYEDPLLSLSLGNMGFSTPSCAIESMTRASSPSAALNFECTTGTISTLTDFGITTMFEDQQACSRQKSTQYCNQFLHDISFKEFFNGACKGQKACSIQQVDRFLATELDKNRVEICQSSQSRFFVQY